MKKQALIRNPDMPVSDTLWREGALCRIDSAILTVVGYSIHRVSFTNYPENRSEQSYCVNGSGVHESGSIL
jgi:hypothetical protein